MASYYVDFADGSDSANGTSTSTPWKHCPGDSNATGNAASATLSAGDVVYFKRGVAYNGQVTPGQSGASVKSGSTASITVAGVLTDASGDFVNAGVSAGHQIYIYHSKNSVTGTWVESCGLFTVGSRDSATQLTLSDFDGLAHSTAEMTYVVSNPIKYTSSSSWGTGAATIDGEDIRIKGFGAYGVANRSYLRFEDLSFTNMAGTEQWHCSLTFGDGSTHIYAVNCTFTDNAQGSVWGGYYSIVKGCTVTAPLLAMWTLMCPDVNMGLSADHQLIEGNTVTGGFRSVANGDYMVIRYNSLKDLKGDIDNHGDGIGVLDKGDYMWIYGNTIDVSVELIAMYGASNRPRYLVMHSNVFITRREAGGDYGDNGILGRGSQYIYVINNTWVGLGSAGATNDSWIHLGETTAAADHWTISGNIFTTPTASNLIKIGGEGVNTLVSDYNHFYGGQFYNVPGAGALTYAQWKALGYDAHSIANLTTDPAFVSTNPASYDLKLTEDSPGIGQGENYSTMFTLDRDKNVRPAVGAWDLGAYQYETSEAAVSPGTSVQVRMA